MMRRTKAAILLALMLHAVAPAVVWGEEPTAPVGEGGDDRGPAAVRSLSRENGGVSWGAVAAGAGLVAGIGLGMWLKAEADDRYDRYLATADPETARRHFDDAERYDRLSLIGWVTAEVSFVALFVLLTREDEPRLIPSRGEPLVRADGRGLEVGWRIAP